MSVASAIVAVADKWCALARRVGRAAGALEDHWIGDVIAILCLFGSLWVLLVAGWVLQ